jgi:beta-N-acetylhexosaminidase
VVAAVRSGEISQQRLDEAVYRNLRLKWNKGLFRNAYVNEAAVDRTVGTRSSLATAQRIADRTTTLVKNDRKLLPLRPGPRKVLVTGWNRAASTQPVMPQTLQTLAAEFTARRATADVYETGRQPSQATIDQAVTRARASDLTVVTTAEAWNLKAYGPAQQNLVNALLATGKPVIVIAVGAPYDAAHLTSAPTFLAAYNSTPGPVLAAARAIFGDVRPTGRLPVSITAVGQPGTTLYPYGHGLTYGRR